MKIAVTGGAGQIAYNLLFRIASGEMLGLDQPVSLHILERPEAMAALSGVVMELDDCAFPLLEAVVVGTDLDLVFKDVDMAILVGAQPRTKGMERKDLLMKNAAIFIEQGKVLNKVASKDLQVFVVGNPCNTNCWITMKCAPDLNPKNFHAMTKLDENRAKNLIAKKSKSSLAAVNNMAIWGNHSATQVPDIVNATLNKKPLRDAITDQAWLEGEFFTTLQQRGAAIIAARGKSSAASAANGVVDTVKDLVNTTPEGEWYSDAVHSKGNPYGIDEDLIFSFPCRNKGVCEWEFITGLKWDAFLEEKIKLTEKELIEERETVRKLF